MIMFSATGTLSTSSTMSSTAVWATGLFSIRLVLLYNGCIYPNDNHCLPFVDEQTDEQKVFLRVPGTCLNKGKFFFRGIQHTNIYNSLT